MFEEDKDKRADLPDPNDLWKSGSAFLEKFKQLEERSARLSEITVPSVFAKNSDGGDVGLYEWNWVADNTSKMDTTWYNTAFFSRATLYIRYIKHRDADFGGMLDVYYIANPQKIAPFPGQDSRPKFYKSYEMETLKKGGLSVPIFPPLQHTTGVLGVDGARREGLATTLDTDYMCVLHFRNMPHAQWKIQVR